MDKINKKIVGLVVVVALIVGGLSFFAGTKYAGAKDGVAGNLNRTRGVNGGPNFTARGGMGGGFTGGKVISKDDKSITVQARDGSSKVVFFTAATPVMKMVAGANSDITVGKDITVMGTANPDGSVSASSIQVRPAQADTTPKTQ